MLKLIIVEDEEIIRRGLICTIDWLRYHSTIIGDAADGEAALALIRERQPDVVLTDIRMPRLDGIALARTLRAEGNPTRIVFLTSYADFDYAQEAVRLEAADYLLKPVNEQELGRLLERLHAEKAAATGTVGGPVRTVPDIRPLVQWREVLSKAQRGGNPYVQAVLSIIQRDYREKLSLETIAAAQGVSSSYLSRKLREDTGHTFGSLLAKYRLRQSIELLAAGTWRVYEIAELTGFGDYKNFCQVFKKYLHVSPKAFMQQAAGGLLLEGEGKEHES